MSKPSSLARQLAAQLRQSVQGCTIHPHGPIHAWARIEKACKAGEADREQVALLALESCNQRIQSLREKGAGDEDARLLKEITTKAFINKILLSDHRTEKQQSEDHQTPKLTVDAIILHPKDCQQIVLIERKNPPHGWALPGGFVEVGESVEEAVARETLEETSLQLKDLRQLSVYSDPQRDPRQHTVSVVFVGIGNGNLSAKDDAKNAKYYSLDQLPKLVFDHKKIIEDYKAAIDQKKLKGA